MTRTAQKRLIAWQYSFNIHKVTWMRCGAAAASARPGMGAGSRAVRSMMVLQVFVASLRAPCKLSCVAPSTVIRVAIPVLMGRELPHCGQSVEQT